MSKSLQPMKATVLDDDAFRLLAIPFGGPIPSPVSPLGVDRDGEWFSHRTDIRPEWFSVRLVDWHHRGDPRIGRSVIGKATDLEEDEDGWWVTVWLNRQADEFRLLEKLVNRGIQLFGSSETLPGMTKKADTGEILRWPYIYQTLSPLPRNVRSVLRPRKSADPADIFFGDLARFLDGLAGPSIDPTGEMDAKAGRVLAARNEARLREAAEALETEGWNPVRRKKVLAAIADVLEELDRYTDPAVGSASD